MTVGYSERLCSLCTPSLRRRPPPWPPACSVRPAASLASRAPLTRQTSSTEAPGITRIPIDLKHPASTLAVSVSSAGSRWLPPTMVTWVPSAAKIDAYLKPLSARLLSRSVVEAVSASDVYRVLDGGAHRTAHLLR